jgi:hypothetical protein
MIKVNIDGELFAEALSISGYWNGFAEPIFSGEEMGRIHEECVRLGWDNVMDDGMGAHLAGWHYLGNNEWASYGWIWEQVEEGN